MEYVVQNLNNLLKRHGFMGIIKCLLQVRSIMTNSECYYLNNKIWIDPYLCWVNEQYKIQQQQQNNTPQDHHRIDNTNSILGQIIEVLEQLLDEEHASLKKDVKSSFKEGLGLDLYRYESMLETAESNDESGDDNDFSDDEESDENDDDGDDDDDDTSDEIGKDGDCDSNDDPKLEMDKKDFVRNQRPLLDDLVGLENNPDKIEPTNNGVCQNSPLIEELS